MQKNEMVELADIISKAVVTALKENGLVGTQKPATKQSKSAYSKTESLLYNYRGFKRILEERTMEIAEIRLHGVPQRSGSIVQYGGNSGGVNRITTPEESAEAAIRHIEQSMEETKRVIDLIDRSMYALRNDPYYKLLEYLYFEGRTQEDIALTFNCSQVNVSKNKSRLIKELALRIFPDQAIAEMMV